MQRSLPDDPDALKAIILAQHARTAELETSVKAYEGLVQALKIRIAKLRRQKFGRSSEKIGREIAQLELALEARRAEGCRRRHQTCGRGR